MLKSCDKKLLKDYCFFYDLEYKSIRKKLYYMSITNKYDDIKLADKMEIARIRFINEEIKIIIRYCQENIANKNKKCNYKEICKFLNLYEEKVKYLSYKYRNIYIAILVVWFHGDIVQNGCKSISRKQLLRINKKDTSKLNIYEKICKYKCGEESLFIEIMNYEEKYIKRNIYKVASKYSLTINKSIFDDLFAQSCLILIKTIKNICFTHIGQVIKYLDISFYCRLYDYVGSNYKKSIEFEEKYMKGCENNYEFLQ